MALSRSLKILIGVLTAWPVFYMLLFFAFVLTSMFWMRAFPESASGMPVGFFVLMALHVGTMLSMIALTAFYIVYLFKTDRVTGDKKALWAVVLFLGNVFAMPVFFYLYVWPEGTA
jgi:hypothetical protein